ncbi:MAG: hypothetical protein OXF79_21760 [Chloroflexi bacterium]|nr:hypothetical protein [Chloroflexota bacterium]
MWEWLRRLLCGDMKMTVEERRQDRRSKVRVTVTYWAALYIFVGAAALIALALWGNLTKDNFQIVREIFTLALPIATGVITYWFATRQQGQTEATASGASPASPSQQQTSTEKPETAAETSQTTETPRTGEEAQRTEPEKPDSQSQASSIPRPGQT